MFPENGNGQKPQNRLKVCKTVQTTRTLFSYSSDKTDESRRTGLEEMSSKTPPQSVTVGVPLCFLQKDADSAHPEFVVFSTPLIEQGPLGCTV